MLVKAGVCESYTDYARASVFVSMIQALQSSDEEENESGPRRKMRTGPSKAASEAQQQLQNALMGGDYNMGSGFQASGYFPCRECTAVFRSKQVGWKFSLPH